jgi:hypothetical protein
MLITKIRSRECRELLARLGCWDRKAQKSCIERAGQRG